MTAQTPLALADAIERLIKSNRLVTKIKSMVNAYRKLKREEEAGLMAIIALIFFCLILAAVYMQFKPIFVLFFSIFAGSYVRCAILSIYPCPDPDAHSNTKTPRY